MPDTCEQPVIYADKRLVATWKEVNAANKALRELFEKWGIPQVPSDLA